MIGSVYFGYAIYLNTIVVKLARLDEIDLESDLSRVCFWTHLMRWYGCDLGDFTSLPAGETGMNFFFLNEVFGFFLIKKKQKLSKTTYLTKICLKLGKPSLN